MWGGISYPSQSGSPSHTPQTTPPKQDNSVGFTQESTVFNNPEDSDIVLEYNGKRVHAHRAILRMASPFFERIFQSQWPVAKSPVFSLGEDDDPEIIDAMLRHMYNLPYSQAKAFGSDTLKFHIDVFMLADKYDCPSLRSAAVSSFRHTADLSITSGFNTGFGSLINNIANLCGSNAVQTADPSLRDTALNFCAVNYSKLFTYIDFRVQLHAGSLFDTDAMHKLLITLGELASEKNRSLDPSHISHIDGWNCLAPGINYSSRSSCDGMLPKH